MADIVLVQSTDTPNTGRNIWNVNDTNLNNALIADIAALAAHKISGDHDGRYYTESEVNAIENALRNSIEDLGAEVVLLSGAQTVAGKKTLTDDLQIKKASPAIEIFNSDESLKARLYGYDSGSDRVITLQMEKTPGNYENLLMAKKGAALIDSPDRDMYAKGKKLATEEYVQERVRSGIQIIPITRYISALAAGTFHFLNPDGQKLFIIPISGSRLAGVSVGYCEEFPSSTGWGTEDLAADYSFVRNLAVPQILRAQLVAGAYPGADLGLTLELYAINAAGTETKIFNSWSVGWQGAPGSIYVTVSLKFAI